MKRILMLLSNAFMPDPRPYFEAISLVKTGYGVKILCWDRAEGLPERENIDGIEVLRIKVPSSHARGYSQIFFLGILWVKMIGYLLRHNFDIIYCHDFDTLPVGLAIKTIRHKPLIFDSHDVYSLTLGKNIPRFLKKFIKYLEKLLINKADSVIVANPGVKGLYRSYGAKNISLVENWKDLNSFQVAQEILDNKKGNLGIKEELIIVYIANLGEERIIRPLLNIVKKDKETFLIIGGDGVQRNIVEEAAKESLNIKYLGYVPFAEVCLYTALADVVYYGFDKNYGAAELLSPNKLFEALAAGKAFLGGNFGEMGKIILEERCGIVLDDFNENNIKSAINIFKNRTQLQIFKDNAKKAALEKYNWANAQKFLLQAVSSLKK